ncbi:hypothetical protein NHX12_004486 [Muraenolepis orangiensis]|uniref:HAT C-terminal dimerisation domain-containing protein n=1 Tax=Muraenolepis orangiensis TaxID=630683 RepID=A0A9Q0IC89_9TELE|nr:hypothetical protein NHX12_004486 [Muraenolepis orangiensis]
MMDNWMKGFQHVLNNLLDELHLPEAQQEIHESKDVKQLDGTRYEEQVQSILTKFESRFTDFSSIEPIASYLCFPIGGSIDVDEIVSKANSLFDLDSSAVENEILTLSNDIDIKSSTTPGTSGQFWNLLLEQKYPNLRRCALNLTALFPDLRWLMTTLCSAYGL